MAMRIITLAILLTVVSSVFGADDIRSKVADGKDEKQLTRRIDPDESIYGIPFGTREDEFIARHGKPTGYVRLSGAETAMVYGKSHAFIFKSGSLVGIRITHNIMDWKLSNASAPSPFNGINWQLSNGIETEMSLAQVRKILGDKLSTKRYRQYYYMTEKAQVELDFSHHTSEGDSDDAYRVFGIFLKQGASEPDDAWLGTPEEFGGVGMVIGSDKTSSFPQVLAVRPDGPADKAGVRPGMAILAVDATALSGKTLQESSALLRGKPGSKATFEIFDAAAQKTNKVTITRTPMVLRRNETSTQLPSGFQLPPDFRPDTGDRVHKFGRPATGDADVLPLRDTDFRAVVCASHYTDTQDTDPDFYSISVERQYGGRSWVYFERQLPASSIPASVLTAKARDIVSFDPARRLVTFNLGATNYTYRLPQLP
jgi:hypothetical protein